MIIEIKDLPDQKVKSVDVHIDFLENSDKVKVDYVPDVDHSEKVKPNDVVIPDEMLNSEF